MILCIHCCPVQCLTQYTRAEVLAASYSISCPDPGCQHTVSAACLDTCPSIT